MVRLGDSGQEMTLKSATKNIRNITLPGLDRSRTRSLFVFGEDNSVRKYAKMIVEWGYPCVNQLSVVYTCRLCCPLT